MRLTPTFEFSLSIVPPQNDLAPAVAAWSTVASARGAQPAVGIRCLQRGDGKRPQRCRSRQGMRRLSEPCLEREVSVTSSRLRKPPPACDRQKASRKPAWAASLGPEQLMLGRISIAGAGTELDPMGAGNFAPSFGWVARLSGGRCTKRRQKRCYACQDR
jgi:hypothetical protein